jgi:3-keto-L-gulonate-6-phosphate decarboxylase
MPQIPQQSKTQIQCQEEIVIDVHEKKEKQKILNNLPKVGVSCAINHYSLDSISDFLTLWIYLSNK